MRAKPWYTSKTLWFNALTAALAVGDQLAGVGVIRGDAALAVNLIGNIGLRFLTKEPLK
jgi:hypothetical protein